MRFEDERYVRLYTRDTTTWLMLPWQSRAVAPLILRKVDRAGILDLGDDGIEGLAVHIGIPFDVVEPGVEGLVEHGTVEVRNGILAWPRFVEAHESSARPNRARGRNPYGRREIRPALRAAVMARDGLICGICRLTVEPGDMHIDHVLPVARGGTNVLENLQVAHSLCNQSKGAR